MLRGPNEQLDGIDMDLANAGEMITELTRQRDELNKLCEFNQRTMEELLVQRDELLAACEKFKAYEKAAGEGKDVEAMLCYAEATDTMTDAIARAKGCAQC